jgi:hypothetical protein
MESVKIAVESGSDLNTTLRHTVMAVSALDAAKGLTLTLSCGQIPRREGVPRGGTAAPGRGPRRRWGINVLFLYHVLSQSNVHLKCAFSFLPIRSRLSFGPLGH